MHTGVLFNVLVCFISGLIGFLIYRKIQQLRNRNKISFNKGLDYFLLFFGILWFFAGLRSLLFWLGYDFMAEFVWQWIVGPLTYIHAVPIFYFYGSIFFKNSNKLYLAFVGFFTLMTIITVLSFFVYGFNPVETSYWGSKYNANSITDSLFSYGIFLPAFLCLLYESIKRINIHKKSNDFYDKQLIGINLGIFIYMTIAIFDGLALAKDWLLLFVRIIIMVSALTIYFFVTEQKDDE